MTRREEWNRVLALELVINSNRRPQALECLRARFQVAISEGGFKRNRGVLALQTMKIGPVGALPLFCAYAHGQSPPVTYAQIQYEVRQCTMSGSSVICTFRITNLGPARLVMHRCGPGTGVGAGGQTRAYDNLGNEYSGEACTLATMGPVYGDVAARVGASPVEATAVSGTSTSRPQLFLSLSSLALPKTCGLRFPSRMYQSPGKSFSGSSLGQGDQDDGGQHRNRAVKATE